MSQSAYVPLGGGIDLVTPPRQMQPGQCLTAINYECPSSGGYRRIDGYRQIGSDVPGEGPILGVCTFKDAQYAIRKDVGQDTATMYRHFGSMILRHTRQEVEIIDPVTKEVVPVKFFDDNSRYITGFVVNADSSLVAVYTGHYSATGDAVYVLETNSWTLINRYEKGTHEYDDPFNVRPVLNVTYDDGRDFFVSSWSNNSEFVAITFPFSDSNDNHRYLHVYRTSDWQLVYEFISSGPNDFRLDVAAKGFSPDDTILVFQENYFNYPDYESQIRNLHIVSTSTWQIQDTLPIGFPFSVRFNPSGNLMAVSGLDHADGYYFLRVYDVNDSFSLVHEVETAFRVEDITFMESRGWMIYMDADSRADTSMTIVDVSDWSHVYTFPGPGLFDYLQAIDRSGWISASAVGQMTDGRYEFDEGNFYGTEQGHSLYGVGGGKPFEMTADGTVTVIPDAPSGAKMISVHKNHLFLGFEAGSLQFSGIGDPYNWDAATGGAGEIGVGQALSGIIKGIGGVLHVLCRDSIQTLRFSSAADATLEVTNPGVGCRAYSAQSMMTPYFVTERGISTIGSTDKFGDFAAAQISKPVEPLFIPENSPLFQRTSLAGKVIASMVSKSKDQYRVFFSDKTGLYVSPYGITQVVFPDQVRVTHTNEMSDGEEVLLFGDDAGRVYRLDDGRSFNGESVEAYLTLAYTDLGLSSERKRFRRVFWDVQASTESNMRFRAEFDFGAAMPEGSRDIVFQRAGGAWDVDDWNRFAWSAPVVSELPYDIAGSGTAINFSLYSNSVSEPHEVIGYDVIFTRRRLRRG